MNDFTKEELEDISSCIYAVCASSTISQMHYGALQEKIQSMIHNYYGHESRDFNIERCTFERNNFYKMNSEMIKDIKNCPVCNTEIIQDIFSKPINKNIKNGKLMEARGCDYCKIIYEVICV